jgi:hypothetical protein
MLMNLSFPMTMINEFASPYMHACVFIFAYN